MGEPEAGIRLDYIRRIINALAENRELEGLLGAPVEKHVVLLVEGGRFKFNALTPYGENQREYSADEKMRAAEIVDAIIKANYPGTESLPGELM